MFRWTGGTRARANRRLHGGESYPALAPVIHGGRSTGDNPTSGEDCIAPQPTASPRQSGELATQSHEKSRADTASLVKPSVETSVSGDGASSAAKAAATAATTSTSTQASRLLRAMVSAQAEEALTEGIGTYADERRAREREQWRKRRRRHDGGGGGGGVDGVEELRKKSRSRCGPASCSSPSSLSLSHPVRRQPEHLFPSSQSTSSNTSHWAARESAKQERRRRRVQRATGACSLDSLALRWPLRPLRRHPQRQEEQSAHGEEEGGRVGTPFEDRPLLPPAPPQDVLWLPGQQPTRREVGPAQADYCFPSPASFPLTFPGGEDDGGHGLAPLEEDLLYEGMDSGEDGRGSFIDGGDDLSQSSASAAYAEYLPLSRDDGSAHGCLQSPTGTPRLRYGGVHAALVGAADDVDGELDSLGIGFGPSLECGDVLGLHSSVDDLLPDSYGVGGWYHPFSSSTPVECFFPTQPLPPSLAAAAPPALRHRGQTPRASAAASAAPFPLDPTAMRFSDPAAAAAPLFSGQRGGRRGGDGGHRYPPFVRPSLTSSTATRGAAEVTGAGRGRTRGRRNAVTERFQSFRNRCLQQGR